MAELLSIIKSRRTIRRFAARTIEASVLLDLVDAARLAPTGANRQPLQFVVVSDPAVCSRVFANVAWAGYIRPKRNPGPGQEPKAYIVILVDKRIAGEHGVPLDVGAAAENLMLGAWSLGIGSCWMGAIQRPEIARILGVPDHMAIDTLVALGYPAEEPVAEDMVDESEPNAVKYYLDASDRLHVPKRPIATVGHLNAFGTPLEK